MATTLPDDPTKKKNAFGDAAAQAANPSAGFVAPGAILNRPAAPAAPSTPALGITPSAAAPQATTAAPSLGMSQRPSQVSSGAPLDAQAQADRQAASGFVAGVKDINNRAGAAILDVATAVPRGILGAYDSAVVRPVRAAGLNMAYTTPLLTPSGVDPSSMTPYYDKVRAADAAAAPATAITAAAPPPAGPGRGILNPPTVQGGPAPVAPTDASAGGAAAAGPAGQIPGGITRVDNSYSGTNVSGSPSINGAPGRGTVSDLSGSGVSSADRIAQYQRDGQHLRDMAGIQREIDAQNGQAPGMTVFGTRPVRPSRTAMEQAGETARAGMREAGENRRAAASTAQLGFRNALDRDEFALKKDAAAFDSRSRSRVEAAQLKVQNAATPEARRAAAEELAALSGKANQDNFSAVEIGGGTEPIDPANPMLGVRTLPKTPVIFNKATGQIVTPPAAPAARPAIAEGSISTVNGKSARFTGGKWVPL